MEENRVEVLKKDVAQMYAAAAATFEGVDGEDKEFLQRFAFVCMLSYDVYVKKLLIEKIIDGMKVENIKTEKTKPEKTKAEKAKTEKIKKDTTKK